MSTPTEIPPPSRDTRRTTYRSPKTGLEEYRQSRHSGTLCPASSRSLRLCRTSICCRAPWTFAWICCPRPAPHVQNRDAQHKFLPHKGAGTHTHTLSGIVPARPKLLQKSPLQHYFLEAINFVIITKTRCIQLKQTRERPQKYYRNNGFREFFVIFSARMVLCDAVAIRMRIRIVQTLRNTGLFSFPTSSFCW